jgi:carbonic anhydrase
MNPGSLLWVLGAAGSSALPAAQAQDTDPSHYVSPWKTPWDYEGPRGAEHWSTLDPGYALCNLGKEQSPIDIRDTHKAKLPVLRFQYRSAPLGYVINNGHTIRVDYHDALGAGSLLVVGDKRYQLMQFHFHRPSEEYVHGSPYDMVLHLMHRAADGQVAGVAVFLKAGAANRTIQRILAHMPATEGRLAVPSVTLDPTGMLPHDAAYYMYRGSQTAPPCNEGVTWFVLKTAVTVSAAQIAAFAALYPHDVRPLQPLNGRVIEESE